MTETLPDNLRRRADLADPVARYRRMYEIREFEERIVGLFSQGLVHGTTHTCQGQEALAVALADVLNIDDVVTCTYRGHGIALALGMTPTSVLGEIMGRTVGCIGGLGGSMHLSDLDVGLLPTFAIVGAGMPVAAGAALAFQTRSEERVAVSVCGDGATNIGAFHEALNLAAVWRLPVVFVIDNNVYAEYSRIDLTTSVTELWKRAAAYGLDGESVDGMDLTAVTDALRRHVDRTRAGGGPSILEVRTYRYAGHSRADAATYRPAGELEQWQKADPLLRARNVLLADGVVDETTLDELERAIAGEIDHTVATVSAAPEPNATSLFVNVWSPSAKGGDRG